MKPLEAVKAFQEQGYGDIVVITCYPYSSLARIARNIIAVPDAQEVGVAQTRSFTNMMFALIWWLLPPTSPEIYSDIQGAGQQLIDNYQPLARELGEDLSIDHLYFLGDGPLYGLASEAMLKMKEMSLTNSEAYHFLEFRHGPKSVVNKNSLIIGLLDDERRNYELSVLSEMKQYGAKILVISGASSPIIEKVTDKIVLFGNDLPKGWQFPFYLPFLQLLALYRSMAKKLNPDLPEHLESVVILES